MSDSVLVGTPSPWDHLTVTSAIVFAFHYCMVNVLEVVVV